MNREENPDRRAGTLGWQDHRSFSGGSARGKKSVRRKAGADGFSSPWSRLFCQLAFLVLMFSVMPARAAITIPGADGSDGALHITADTLMDLSQAVDGTWNDDNTANAGKGIYDPEKWAVVFKYTSVTIDSGATLSFLNHPKRAPVVWLVSGDVTIEGTLSLNGQAYQASPANAEPGPGGFRGGVGTYASGASAAAGLGPGGGGFQWNIGYAGSYGSVGGSGSETYGNPSLVPLIGGSGGGGDPEREYSGGGGGGAILIVCQNATVNGSVKANGGTGRSYSSSETGGGSGGGIRLVTDTLSGTGTINALGGGGYNHGGLGRIRLERVVNDNTLTVVPDASLLSLTPGQEPVIWPPSDAPLVKIVSIGGEAGPDDPYASFGTHGADVVLPEVSTAQVVIETENVEQASQVKVRVTPKFNRTFTVVDATIDTVVSTDPLLIRWVADIPVSTGYAAVQVKVIRP